jgi:hypothetical protein
MNEARPTLAGQSDRSSRKVVANRNSFHPAKNAITAAAATLGISGALAAIVSGASAFLVYQYARARGIWGTDEPPAGAAEDVLGERRARVDLAAFLPVALAERLERDEPVVELLTADPERMLWRLIRAGDEAVDRHRDVQLQLAHRSSLCRMVVGPPSASEVIDQASEGEQDREVRSR